MRTQTVLLPLVKFVRLIQDLFLGPHVFITNQSISCPVFPIQVIQSLSLSADISNIFPVFITTLNGARNRCVSFVSPFYWRLLTL